MESVDSESELNFEGDLENVFVPTDLEHHEEHGTEEVGIEVDDGTEAGTEAAVASIQIEDELTDEQEHELFMTDQHLLPQPAENAPDVEVSLEDQLKSSEKLDRSSPDLWPQNLPTTAKQILIKNRLKTGETDHSGSWAQGLDPEDINLLHQFGSLTSSSLIEEVKKLQNIAYTLGLDEMKEMTRGKLLHVLDESQIKKEGHRVWN